MRYKEKYQKKEKIYGYLAIILAVIFFPIVFINYLNSQEYKYEKGQTQEHSLPYWKGGTPLCTYVAFIEYSINTSSYYICILIQEYKYEAFRLGGYTVYNSIFSTTIFSLSQLIYAKRQKTPLIGGFLCVYEIGGRKELMLGGAKWCGNTKLPSLAKNVISLVKYENERILLFLLE